MLIELTHSTAGYGDLEVLRDVSVHVQEGEWVALIGPNGAGKTTVLKAIMGIATRKGGDVVWKGTSITTVPVHSLLEEGIGFVPQGRLVFPSLTTRENLEMGGYLLDHAATKKDRLETVLGYFPALRPKLSAPANALSGGEQQMVAIGRALMMSPELLMLDEPSLGLSPKVRHEVFETLKRINGNGTAILMVEQNVRLALQYASRGYLLVNGVVRHQGTAVELSDPQLMHSAFLV
jgi:branched-chain amino acid transport system ATP-binding protein